MEGNNNNSLFFNLHIDEEGRATLKKVAQWARITALCGFISAGITLMQGIMQKGNAAFAINIAFTLLATALSVLLNVFLLRFANATNSSMDNNNQALFDQGTGYLNNYFKTLGILLIIVLAVLVLAIIAGMFGLMMR